MIGKPEWFKYRMFGWGLGLKTWQSVVYVIVVAALLAGSLALAANDALPIWIAALIFVIVVTDVIHIMTQLPKVSDERENYHQLIIERNCSFAAIAALFAMAFYEAYEKKALFTSYSLAGLPFDISIVVVLVAMTLAKIISAIYVKSKM